MKILFSADWHLGHTLGGANQQPRLADQTRQMGQVAALCEQHEVDVLAIAGDVFEAQERGPARAAVRCMTEALAAALSRGMRVVAIAGNHDRDYFMDTANVWLDAATPAGDERIIFRTRPELITVTVRDERVNFALMPFPTPARYDLRQEDAGGVGQRNELLAKLFVDKMEELRKRTEEQRLPTILLTHVTVSGTTVKAHRISQRDDIVIPRAGFPSFELTVVGHIHKPEQIGAAPFYYVGALDRMDVGEKLYEPRVLVADIRPDGVRDITSIPLAATAFVAVEATCEDELVEAHRRMPHPAETLVKLTLRVPQFTSTQTLVDRARELFPRLYGNVEHEWEGVDVAAPSVMGLNPAHVEDTVRTYLEQQQNVPLTPEDRAAIMDLVTELRALQPAEAGA